jgi:iron uptake system component EfeO
MHLSPRLLLALLALVCAAGLLAGCGTTTKSTDGAGSPGVISVQSSDDACDLSATEAPAGGITFEVENTGSKVTEFYLYAADGKKVVAEVENIGPGLTRNLTLTAEAGTYVTACKPGMKGAGIRGDFVVTDS